MKKALWTAAIAILLQSATAYAEAPNEQMMEMLKSMQKQMSEMQRTIDAQNARIIQLEGTRAFEAPAPAAAAPGAPSDADWQKGIKDNIGEAIPWLKGAKYGGDFRLRHEFFNYFDRKSDAGSTTTANDRDRHRFRFRLRWGFEKDYGDDWKFGFRLASGSSTDNTSTNQTLGNRGHFTFKDIFIEKAYAQYSPNGLKDYGALKGFTVGAGKFDNPFMRYSTSIVWDGDVTPEGLYEKATFKLYGDEENFLNLHATAGQFIVNENAAVESDAQIFGYQGALEWSTYGFGTEQPITFSLAGSYYDYTNWFQTVTSNTAGTSYLRTNTLVADEFAVLDIYPEVSFHVGRTPVTLWYDWAQNLDNVGTDDVVRSGGNDIHDQDDAWGVGFKIGKAKKKGSWELHYGYYEIGANSVVAAYSDSDFGGPGTAGFTNRKGHKFGLGYQLTDSIAFNWTNFLVQPLNPSTAVANSTNEHVYRSQADLVYKF